MSCSNPNCRDPLCGTVIATVDKTEAAAARVLALLRELLASDGPGNALAGSLLAQRRFAADLAPLVVSPASFFAACCGLAEDLRAGDLAAADTIGETKGRA